MKKREYLRAVREARRIFVAVQPVKRKYRQVRISKRWARDLVAGMGEAVEVEALWLDGADRVLMVG